MVWNQKSGILCLRNAHEATRIRALYGSRAQTALHGSPLWKLDSSTNEWIVRRESKWLRGMFADNRRAEGEDFSTWWRGINRAGQIVRARCRQPSLLQMAAAASWGWWGHLAREHGGAAATAAWKWRSFLWWREEQNDPRGMRHPTSGWLRGPEEDLQAWMDQKAPGSLWKDVAQDRNAWSRGRASFVAWTNERLKGPKMPRTWATETVWTEACGSLAPWFCAG